MTNPYDPRFGRLAVPLADFEQHYLEGTGFRHNATQIDLSPSLVIDGYSATTVQNALSTISGYIISAINNGIGFFAISDGYDTYHNAISTPNAPYDSSIPGIDTFLTPLFSSISTNSRLYDGGIIFLPAGTYKVSNTITIPPGFVIVGEGFGTKIINQTTSGPVFIIKKDSTRTTDSGVDSLNKFMYARDVKFYNLTIADNFVEPKFLGDTSYLAPRLSTSAKPLVSVQDGASFTADNVKFIGKTTYSGSVITAVTSFAISVDATFPVTTGTYINVNQCFIDGFAQPVSMISSGKVNDYLVITNSYVRAYGYLNADFSSITNNTFFQINAGNAIISNNNLYGYDSTVVCLIYIDGLFTPPNIQDNSRVSVFGNNISINKGSNSSNNSFQYFSFDNTNGFTYHEYGNNFIGNPTSGTDINDFQIVANSGGGTSSIGLNANGDINVVGNFNMDGDIVLPNGSDILVGTHPAGSGNIALSNDSTIHARDGGNTVDIGVLSMTGTDIIIGDATNATNLHLRSSSNVMIDNGNFQTIGGGTVLLECNTLEIAGDNGGVQNLFADSNGNIGIGGQSISANSGEGVLFISNSTTIPTGTTPPVAGGILYTSTGSPQWIDNAGRSMDMSQIDFTLQRSISVIQNSTNVLSGMTNLQFTALAGEVWKILGQGYLNFAGSSPLPSVAVFAPTGSSVLGAAALIAPSPNSLTLIPNKFNGQFGIVAGSGMMQIEATVITSANGTVGLSFTTGGNLASLTVATGTSFKATKTILV